MIASIAVSGFGTWSYNVGIAVYAYDQTHSAVWVAAVTVGRYVPALALSWLAGRLADRFPRRRLAMTSDLVCTATMVVLTLVGALDAPVWILTCIAAVSSTAARMQASAVLALAADVVVESKLARASMLAGASEAVATAVGAAAASAVLIRFTPPTLFLLNALTFVASAALIAKVRPVPARRPLPRPHVTRLSEAGLCGPDRRHPQRSPAISSEIGSVASSCTTSISGSLSAGHSSRSARANSSAASTAGNGPAARTRRVSFQSGVNVTTHSAS